MRLESLIMCPYSAIILHSVTRSPAVENPREVLRDRNGDTKAGCGFFMLLRACVAAYFLTPCQEDQVMAHGTVKWFNDQKGFGFITPDEGPDVFVHYLSLIHI